MYNLYNIFVRKENIVKSIGLEYSSLDYNSCILILIDDMVHSNLLDDNSKSIVNNPKFYQLLFEVKYEDAYAGMYFLDTILFLLNTEASKSLIMLNGTNITNISDIDSVPDDILKILLLEQTDLNTLISMYNTNSRMRSLLEDPNVLSDLISNITLKLKHLPGHLRYKNYQSFTINNITFEKFVNWYKHEFYYVSDCEKYNSPLVCYSGARDNDDNIGAQKYLKMILNYGWYNDSYSYKEIPPKYLLEIIDSDKRIMNDNGPMRREVLYDILVDSLLFYPKYYQLTDDDIKGYSGIIFESEIVLHCYEAFDNGDYRYILINSLNDPRLFKLIIDTDSEYRNSPEMKVFDYTALDSIHSDLNIVDGTDKIKYRAKFIEYGREFINNMSTHLRDYYNQPINSSYIIDVSNEKLNTNYNYVNYLYHLNILLNLLKDTIGKQDLINILNKSAIFHYEKYKNTHSIMINFINEYILNA